MSIKHHNGTVQDCGSILCAGCGKLQGLCCFVVTEDYEPKPLPEFPFTEDDCPVCSHKNQDGMIYSADIDSDYLAENVDIKTLQQAIFIKRTKGE